MDGTDTQRPFTTPLAPLPEPNAAEPSEAPVHALRHRRILLRLVLMPATIAIVAGSACVGLHRLFYRDVPVRSVASVAAPAAPEAGSSPSLPAPPIPVSSTPTPSPASQGRTMPSATSVPPPSTMPAARLRQDFDDFRANSGRNGTMLSETQRGAPPGEAADRRLQDNQTATPPSAAPGLRVVVHAQAGSEAGDMLSARLLASLRPRFGTVETRRVAATPAKPSIRYFHPEDEPSARLAAAWLADTGLNWALQDFSAFRPLPSRGTIEVWLPKQP